MASPQSSILDPEKTRIHLLPRHLVALAALLLGGAAYAYDLRSEVARLGMRLDGLGDAPGISVRVQHVETEQGGLRDSMRSLEEQFRQLRAQVETRDRLDMEDRRRLGELLTRIEKQLDSPRTPSRRP